MIRSALLLSAAIIILVSPRALHAQEPDEPPRQLPSAPVEVKVELRVSPADAKIYRGDELLGAGQATLMLSAGTHVVRFEREGYTTLTQEIRLAGDDTIPALVVQVHMSRVEPERVIEGRTGGLVEGMGDARKTAGWAGFAVGMGLIATSVYLGLDSGVPEGCTAATPATCDNASSSAPAIVAGSFGGALLLGGIGLLVWDSLAGAAPAQSAAPRIAPAVGQGSAGIVLDWRF